MTFSEIAKYFWPGLLPIVHAPCPHEQEQKVQEMEIPSLRMTVGESKTVLEKRKHDSNVSEEEEEEWSLPRIDLANNIKKQPQGKRSKKSRSGKKAPTAPEKVFRVQQASCPSTVVGQFIRKRFFEDLYFGLIARFDGDYFNVIAIQFLKFLLHLRIGCL